MLKLGDGAGKKEQAFEPAEVEVKSCQLLDLSQSWNGSDVYYLSDKSDPINFCKNEGNCRDVPCPNATSDICLIANLFYMQKTVTEVELPHFPVSTNKFTSPTVKDTCIDQLVQHFEKVLVEYDKVDKDIDSSSILPKVTVSSVLVEEMTDNGSSKDFKPSSTNEVLGSFGKNLEKKEFNTDFPQVDSSSHNDSIDENQDLRQNFDQVTEQYEKLTTMASPMQAKDISIAGNESKVINNQQIVQTRIDTGTEEPIIGSTASTRISFAHLIHEDSNLPGAAALCGPITTSGHIPYSGNISLRSDSSATSTHSFAFPILQSEWNSSPIKMAKADRRHLRKHRWRTALICCKF